MSATTTSPRVVFFGNERLVSGLPHTDAPLLKGLIERDYNIVALVVNYEPGTSRNNRELEVAEIAKAHNIPVLAPNKLRDIAQELRDLRADIAVLAAYGKIIPQDIIDIFTPHGIINIHPSLLPRHRGPTPIESAILEGDTETGVSIMQLTAGMDTGPVYAQQTLSLSGQETKFDIYSALSHLGAEMLFELLPGILDGSRQPASQTVDGTTYSQLIKKTDGYIDPEQLTADQIERCVRAYLHFPKSRLNYKGRDIIITKAHVAKNTTDNAIVIPCADNTLLAIDELITPNGKTASAEAYVRGLR